MQTADSKQNWQIAAFAVLKGRICCAGQPQTLGVDKIILRGAGEDSGGNSSD